MKKILTFSIVLCFGLVLLSAMAAPVSHAQSIEAAEMISFECDGVEIGSRSDPGTIDFTFELQRTNPSGPVEAASGSFQQTVPKPGAQVTFIPWLNITGTSNVLSNGLLAGGDYMIANSPLDDPGRTISLSGFNTILLHYSAGPLHCDCGDGDLDSGEECDDGNNENGDGCDENCIIEPFCGDGTQDPGEECDDGNNENGDGCDENCEIEPLCGDGTLDPGEECDDGNSINGDGCNANCRIEFCGDNIVQPGLGEECDDGNNNNLDGCRNDCTLPFCGDGIVDAGEDCDDGNNINGDGCDEYCMIEDCGCESKVTDLTLMYNGGTLNANIMVVQKKNDVVAFNGIVNPGEQFSFIGLDKKGTLSTDIFIYVNGMLNTEIHTSCSQPIGPGLVSGDFEVKSGSSRLGLPLCPVM